MTDHKLATFESDKTINEWVEWIDKRCEFTDHQKDYVFFGIKQIVKSIQKEAGSNPIPSPNPDAEKPEFDALQKEIDRLKSLFESASTGFIQVNEKNHKRIQELEAEVSRLKEEHNFIGGLLAVLHGDGGHYQEKYGTKKALEDAIELIHKKWVTNEHLHA